MNSGIVIMLNVEDPYKPIFLDAVLTGVNSGVHYMLVDEEGKRLVVVGYFLDQDDFGLVLLVIAYIYEQCE
jgi:hypothetical protein